MEKLSISDVLLSYKNDSDKIAILGKAIEMMLEYTDKIEASFSNINEKIQMIAEATISLDAEIKRINDEVTNLKSNVTSDISKLLGAVKETTAVAAAATTAPVAAHSAPPAPPAPPPQPRTSIVEENLMKPSSFGKSLGSAPAGAPGGGMSIRSAMMAEIKQKLHGSSPAPAAAGLPAAGEPSMQPTAQPEKAGEIGGGYIPKIHQPREAKVIEGGLVSKMNQLLETKFKAGSGSAAPPKAPPVAGGPPKGPSKSPPVASPPKSGSSSFLPSAPSPQSDAKKEDKKKEKKEDKKDKKKDPQLSDLERKIREKLG